jgi:hypothetical protein
MEKILPPKPEQRIAIEAEIVALFAQYKRSQLKLIGGGRGSKQTVIRDG